MSRIKAGNNLPRLLANNYLSFVRWEQHFDLSGSIIKIRHYLRYLLKLRARYFKAHLTTLQSKFFAAKSRKMRVSNMVGN